MREVVTTTYTYCDVCKLNDRGNVEADEELSIALTYHGRAKRIDVCPEHKNPTWEEIQAGWVDDIGATATRPPSPKSYGTYAGPKTERCPYCNKLAGQTSLGLLRHAHRAHPEIPYDELRERFGFADRSSPIVANHRGKTALVHCPRCQAPAHGNQGLAQHLIKAHGVHDKAERAELLASVR